MRIRTIALVGLALASTYFVVGRAQEATAPAADLAGATTPYASVVDGIGLTQAEIDLHEAWSICQNYPSTVVNGVQRNPDFWPQPCTGVVDKYNSGLHQKYNNIYAKERTLQLQSVNQAAGK